MRAPIAVALDAPDAATATRWARAVGPHVSVLKVGLELFYREGPAVLAELREQGLLAAAGGEPGPGATGQAAPELFLDLKLHDIPATVAGGMRSVAVLAPRFVTVHATGGEAMIRAAVAAAGEATGGTLVVAAVTVLTSLAEADLGVIGLVGPARDAARRLAALSVDAGAGALVCSPWEVADLRREVGSSVTLITPGVRPAGVARADQSRVATPEEALAAGADLLVVGRPITGAPDPGAAAAALAAGLGPPE
ncbi:MAG: orotidine-5'-phosphate decarboxylase [Frankia sp.]|nr:orotidine-5'-phosphate decarboxylase [Frankia sp.]